MSDLREYYKEQLARLNSQTPALKPYDTSQATPHPPQMSVGAPAVNPNVPPPPSPHPPTVASNMPPASIEHPPGEGSVLINPPGGRTYGAGVSSPGNPNFVPHTAFDPVDMVNNNNEQVGKLTDQIDRHAADKADALTDTAINNQAGAEEKSSLQAQYADDVSASAANDRAAQQQYHQDADKIFKEKQAVVDQMTDMYQRQPTDLWGRAGVNKISGIIGLFMGAFSREPGNPAMNALNTLVEQNLSQQKFQFEMLGNKAKGYDTAYGQLREKLGDTKSAELSFRQTSLQELSARLAAAESSTTSKNAKSNLAAAIAEINSQVDASKQQLLEHSFSQVSAAAQLAAMTRGQDLTHAEHVEAMGAAKAASEATVPGEIYGMTAPNDPSLRLSKAATDKVREEQQGVKKVGMAVENIKKKVMGGSLKDEASRNRLEADLKVALIEADGLSKRVGGAEGELVAQKAGALSIGYKGFLSEKVDRIGLLQMLNELNQASEQALIGGMGANGYKVTPGGQYDHSSEGNAGSSEYEKLEAIPTRGQQQTAPQYSTKTGAAG